MHTNGQRVPVELQAFVIRTSCRSHNVMTQLAFVPIFGNITLVFLGKATMAKNTSISLGPHFDKFIEKQLKSGRYGTCLLYTSPSPRDGLLSRMPSSA